MSHKPLWQYDELKHSGVDYANPAQVQVFDTRPPTAAVKDG